MANKQTSKIPMKHMIVLLPGITGSVLQQNGEDLWGASVRAICNIWKSGGQNLQALRLRGNDSGEDYYGDGIKADRLVQNAQLIPGLVKILDGYSETAKLITDNFDVTEGDIYRDDKNKAANFYQFPYDWRRDNRINAKILKRWLDIRLTAWRNKSSQNKDAKVILLAHSMGGLISRYYLEVLGGWKDAKTLFTFGTPYRGSLDAVNFIANGYKKASIDLTEIMRSLPSVYQLLPTYEILNYKGKYYRISESPVALPNFDLEMMRDATKFHEEIKLAVAENQEEDGYDYVTVPVVGIKQTTFQSAVLKNGTVKTVKALPEVIKDRLDLEGGDGTVPEISAYPPEFSNDKMHFIRSIAEKHGALQVQKQILEDIKEVTARSQFDTSNIRTGFSDNGQKAIDLILEDIYFTDNTIEITAKSNLSESNTLTAKITNLETERDLGMFDFQKQGDKWLLELANIPPAVYSITVVDKNKDETTPVNDLFIVGKQSDYLRS